VAVQASDDFGLGRVGVLLQQADGTEDHAGGAPAALHGVGLDEGFLDGMEATVRGKALDGRDALAGDGADLGQAGARGDTLDEDSTGGTLAFAAAVLGAGEVEVIAKDAEERPIGVGINAPFRPVYSELGDPGHSFLILALSRPGLPDFLFLRFHGQGYQIFPQLKRKPHI
jgi:hypothetical protein